MRQKNHSASPVIEECRQNKAASGRRARRSAQDDMVVTDNLPDRIPVHRREIEVVEMYLGALLDEILRMGR